MSALYPNHACIFAIARLPDTPAFTTPTYGVVSGLLLASNKVAQHNINFQPTGQGAPRGVWAWTRWVEFVNPYNEPVVAQIEIDATQAELLGDLLLEISGQRTCQLKPGIEQRVLVSECFVPEDLRVIRLNLFVPAEVDLGQRFTIGLRFVVNGQVIGGYQHILGISEYAAVIQDTLDILYGALRAVSVGCGISEADLLARRVLATLRHRTRNIASSPRSLRYLAAPLAKLADYINPTSSGACHTIRHQLIYLAGLLALDKTAPTSERLELIRACIDRIYEPASRLARQKAGID